MFHAKMDTVVYCTRPRVLLIVFGYVKKCNIAKNSKFEHKFHINLLLTQAQPEIWNLSTILSCIQTIKKIMLIYTLNKNALHLCKKSLSFLALCGAGAYITYNIVDSEPNNCELFFKNLLNANVQ